MRRNATRRSAWWSGWLALLAAGLTGGCEHRPAGDLPALYPVTGSVIRESQPVAGGSLRFRPQADPDASEDIIIIADVSAEGRFEVHTLHALSQKRAAGAPLGQYEVTYMPPMGDQTTSNVSDYVPLTLATPQRVVEGSNELALELPAAAKGPKK